MPKWVNGAALRDALRRPRLPPASQPGPLPTAPVNAHQQELARRLPLGSCLRGQEWVGVVPRLPRCYVP